MKYQNLFVMPLILATACASTHPGNVGRMMEGSETRPILASAEKQSNASDRHYTFLTFTMENKGNEMLRIKNTEIRFDPEAESTANILVGKDLVAWAEAYDAEKKKDEHNRKVKQALLMVSGAILGIAGGATENSSMQVIGGAAMAGGAGWSLVDAINKGVRDAKNPQKVPDTHVYAPFSVPAEKFIRRWAVVQTAPNQKLEKLFLTLSFEDGSENRYEIKVD